MKVRSIRPVVLLSGSGKSEEKLGERSAPEALLMFWPKLLRPWTLRKPPGQRPSFCVSTLRVYSAVPQRVATSFRPPLATPWSVDSRSTSTTTPFFPSSSRSPPPAAGESGAGPEVAPPGGGDVDGLGVR